MCNGKGNIVQNINLTGAQPSESGSLVGDDENPQRIDVRKLVLRIALVMGKIVGILGQSRRTAGNKVLHYERTGAHSMVPVQCVSISFDNVRAQDVMFAALPLHELGDCFRVGCLELKDNGVFIRGGQRYHIHVGGVSGKIRAGRGEAVAAADQPVIVIGDIGRREFTPVGRG